MKTEKYDIEFVENERKYCKKVFPNKCQLIIERIPTFFTVSIGIWIKVGSKYEKVDERGVSHLLEHLLFRGTQNRSSEDIVRYIESVGGKIDACTERELTCFSVKVLKEDMLRGVELLFDLVTKPNFSEEDIEKEKEIVLREMEEARESYQLYVHELLIKNMFDNSLGYPIYGDKEVLGTIDLNKIELFYRGFYTTENTVIAVAGNFDESSVVDIVGKTFGSLGARLNSNKPDIKLKKGSKIVYQCENTEQVYFCLGTEGLKQKDEDRVAMYIISSILGEGMSSRLYNRIREDAGLAYTIYSYYTLYAEIGAFIITGIIADGTLKKTIEIIKKELECMCNDNVSVEELNMAKAKLKGNFFFNLEPVENAMIRLAKLNDWHSRHYKICEELEMIEKVTVDDVTRVAKKLFNSNNWTLAVIGDSKNFVNEGDIVL